jgi:HSP20 family protein
MFVQSPWAREGLEQLRQEMDRVMHQFLGPAEARVGRWLVPARTFPAVNVWDDGQAIRLEAELPGVRSEDLNLEVVGNQLKLSGRRDRADLRGAIYHRQERGHGEFARTLPLPVDVDVARIEATLRGGVLSVVLPKAEAALARKIPVRAS